MNRNQDLDPSEAGKVHSENEHEVSNTVNGCLRGMMICCVEVTIIAIGVIAAFISFVQDLSHQWKPLFKNPQPSATSRPAR